MIGVVLGMLPNRTRTRSFCRNRVDLGNGAVRWEPWRITGCNFGSYVLKPE